MLKLKLDSWFSTHAKSLPSQVESKISAESPERKLNSFSPSLVEFTKNLINYIDKHLNLIPKPNAEKYCQTVQIESSSVSTECDFQSSISSGTQTYTDSSTFDQVLQLESEKPLQIHIPQHFSSQNSST